MVPSHLENPALTGVLYQVKDNQFLLRIEGVASYLVEDGTLITIDSVPGCEERVIRIYLLSSVFGALFHQRGMLPLHASAIARDGQVVLFLGASGSGKSTLAVAFQQRGYDLLADDITIINSDHSPQPTVVPGFPRLKLWKDTLTYFSYEYTEANRLRKELEKYTIPAQSFPETMLPLKTIYCLEIGSNHHPELSASVKGYTKLSYLTGNTYQVRFLKGMEIGSRHFQQANTLARKVPMKLIKRGRRLDQIDALIDLLEKDFLS
jgi:hypothetical protein